MHPPHPPAERREVHPAAVSCCMLVRHQQCSKGKPTLPISAVSFQEASLSGGPLLARVSIRHTTTHITLQQIQKGAWLLAAVATQTLSPAPRRGGVFGAQAATLHAQREDCIMPFNRTRAHRQHLRHPTIPRQDTLKLPSHQPKHSKALQTHSQ